MPVSYREAARRSWSVIVNGARYNVEDHGGEIRIARDGGAQVWVGARDGEGYARRWSHVGERMEARMLALVYSGDPMMSRAREAKRTRFLGRVEAARRGERRWMIDDDDLREAIARSERDSSPNDPPGYDRGASWLEQDDNEGGVRQAREDGPGFGVIYGQGGMHRYLILDDGEVVYSRRHGGRNTEVASAQAAGFRVV